MKVLRRTAARFFSAGQRSFTPERPAFSRQEALTCISTLCPHAAALLIKGPTEPVLEGKSITLECLYSDSEFNISQVHFEVFSKVRAAVANCSGRNDPRLTVTLADLSTAVQYSFLLMFELFYDTYGSIYSQWVHHGGELYSLATECSPK